MTPTNKLKLIEEYIEDHCYMGDSKYGQSLRPLPGEDVDEIFHHIGYLLNEPSEVSLAMREEFHEDCIAAFGQRLGSQPTNAPLSVIIRAADDYIDLCDGELVLWGGGGSDDRAGVSTILHMRGFKRVRSK
jgi:hypothetical protein